MELLIIQLLDVNRIKNEFICSFTRSVTIRVISGE